MSKWGVKGEDEWLGCCRLDLLLFFSLCQSMQKSGWVAALFSLYSRRESNPDQRFRKPLFYPLNYRSKLLLRYCVIVLLR